MTTLETLALKLDIITMKLENLQCLPTKIDNLQMLMGANSRQTTEDLKQTVKEAVAASAPATKDKKKVATADAAGAEEKKAPVKKSHPSLPELTEPSWSLKGKGDDYDKRADWFIGVLTKYPTHLHTIIGSDEVKRIEATKDYTVALSLQKKQGEREKAKCFIKALKEVRTAEGTFAELGKKLVADYDAQLVILNSQTIGQLTAETPGSTETAAAAAMATLGAPVTVHATTSTATTTSPAAQLATA